VLARLLAGLRAFSEPISTGVRIMDMDHVPLMWDCHGSVSLPLTI
jgi:hypothetical protein